jgi:CheY-like chemotaxis protein
VGEKADPAKVVLVVEDEPDLLEVTRFALECEGFGVETARNGAEALGVLRAGKRPGLVLLDLMMPVMNGWQFLDEVAKVPSLKEIPVVVLTAAGAPGVPGAAEVLHKPIDLGVLIDAVERHARAG